MGGAFWYGSCGIISTSREALYCAAAPRRFTWLRLRLVGERMFQPDVQPDALRTYKHLPKLAAPRSTCKLLEMLMNFGFTR